MPVGRRVARVLVIAALGLGGLVPAVAAASVVSHGAQVTQHGCGFGVGQLHKNKTVTGISHWVNVTSNVGGKANVTIWLYQNGKQVAKNSGSTTASIAVSASVKCVAGDTYQANGPIVAPKVSGTKKTVAVKISTC
jgi:hypothetical protein